MPRALRTAAAAALFALLAATAPLADEAGKTSLGAYPDTAAMFAEIRALAGEFPDNTELIQYGTSVQGRPLLALRITLSLKETNAKPAAVVAANIHGNEWIGNRAAMAVARRLLENRTDRPEVKSLLEKADIFILPCINPDGYEKTVEWFSHPATPARVSRKNAHGVDINRNFPLPGERTVNIEMAGSNDPDSERYTGPAPYSEPESAAVRDFFASHTNIFASIDFHSNWGTLFPPKCNSAKCEKTFRKICSAATAAQPSHKYPCVMNRHVDSFSGEMEDALFYDFGVLSLCWEIFTQSAGMAQAETMEHPFWSFNPADIAHWTDNERDAVIAAISAAFDATGGKPLPPELRIVEK